MTPVPTPAQWREIEPLLDAALALPADGRRAFLDARPTESVSPDALLAMIDACERVERDAFLGDPAADRFASLWEDPDGDVTAALGDRFAIEGEAGRGGMGVVYRAFDRRHGHRVALKVLRAMVGPRAAARFRREIAVAAALQHEHIVPLLDSGEGGGRLWFTMPLLDGPTLGERLRRDGPLPLQDAIGVLRDVARGLSYAHANGVIHRDLKPENVLFASTRAVVGDFGIARALMVAGGGTGLAAGTHTTTGVRLGTLTHMAPEQATGDAAADHRMDLYALGVVAFQMLTGTLPFPVSSRQAMLTALLAQAPPRVSACRAGVPPRLDQLVAGLLAKRAADRPASADVIVAELSFS